MSFCLEDNEKNKCCTVQQQCAQLVVTKYKVKIISKRMCLLCINFRKVSKLKKSHLKCFTLHNNGLICLLFHFKSCFFSYYVKVNKVKWLYCVSLNKGRWGVGVIDMV